MIRTGVAGRSRMSWGLISTLPFQA
jgi:hypothetical protein